MARPLYLLAALLPYSHAVDFRVHLLHNHKEELASLLTTAIPDVIRAFNMTDRYSFSTFTDKPLPFIGVGTYGNWDSTDRVDYCMKQHVMPTDDIDEIRLGLAEAYVDIAVSTETSAFPILPQVSHAEGVFDALTRLLDKLSKEEDTEATDTKALDVILVTTNTWSHIHGDAAEAIDRWNDKRVYSTINPWSNRTGGFGSDLFPGVKFKDESDIAEWVELSQEFRAADAAGVDPLTVVSPSLLEKYGPYPYPALNDTSTACHESEYPSLATIKESLNHTNVFLAFALQPPGEGLGHALDAKCKQLSLSAATPDECLARIYTQYLHELGVNGTVISMTNGTVAVGDTLLRAVNEYVESNAASSTKEAAFPLAASFAAASGALVTSIFAGILIWQRCADDDLLSIPGDSDRDEDRQSQDDRVPMSRADRVALAFQGFPIDSFSSVEPLDDSPRSSVSLPKQFF
eukprot:Blabericola_migrator_1__640@NODE_115_length_13846_cov_473_148632_g103_i0_p3_GENE_NODE_115_length_13846_cov_473_148632_g103_i0NODE_115_length_13846_cov_473_148632_g103_i0_p3_ORF_typecomplete_len461_score83_25Integrin_beta/PF00362_18/0_16Integrin_beta/PF00362_18/0_14stn_TNFRSF12A/PF12191_8/0_022_NODE_115_length_13846_cov_473_148632_g103_i060567438